MSEIQKLAAKELPKDIEGAVFMLADMPLITPDILNELIGAFQTSKDQKSPFPP
jgi:CTP:molybdopterin cytidylyltransferase MocA